MNKSSCLAPALGVTKFIIVRDMILVTLCSRGIDTLVTFVTETAGDSDRRHHFTVLALGTLGGATPQTYTDRSVCDTDRLFHIAVAGDNGSLSRNLLTFSCNMWNILAKHRTFTVFRGKFLPQKN